MPLTLLDTPFNMSLLLKNLFTKVLLWIIPAIFLFLCINYKKQFSNYDLCTVDAEMAYLYNGLTTAHGNLPYFVDHPGIPLQYLTAGIIRTVHLFRDGNIDEDVVRNPNVYIHATTYLFIVIISLLLWHLGNYTFKVFNNIYAGLTIQLAPFISQHYIGLSPRILPEFFSFTAIAFLFILTINYCKREKNASGWKYSFLFGLLSGYFISIKITLALFSIIPLIVLDSNKEKAKYIFSAIIFTAIWMIPVIFRWDYFYNWMRKLFVHSGKYGSGDDNIVNTDLYTESIIRFTQEYPYFINTLAILLIGLLAYLLLIKTGKIKTNAWHRSFIAFLSVTIISLTVIIKQYHPNYVEPFVIMSVPTFLLGGVIYHQNGIMTRNIFSLIFVITLILASVQLFTSFQWKDSLCNDRIRSQNEIIERFADVPIAAASNYYGSPYYGYSVHYGLEYSSAERRTELFPLLSRIQPAFFSWHSWHGRFRYWDFINYSLPELIVKYKNLHLYLGDSEYYDKFTEKLKSLNMRSECSYEQVFFNDVTKEAVLRIIPSENCGKPWIVNADLEQTDESRISFLADNGGGIWGAENVDTTISRSGLQSMKLSQEHEYGLIAPLSDIDTGQRYIFSVWKLKNGNKLSALGIEIPNQNKAYMLTTEPVEEKDGWVRLEIQLEVNELFRDETLKCFCYHNGDTLNSFGDDLRIEKQLIHNP
jgi:hypothetical protein